MICRGLLRRLVFACIRTSRKIKPVVGEPELLKTPLQVITARAAAQTEKTSGPGLGQTKISGGKILSRRAKWGLVTLGLLASLNLYWHTKYDTIEKCSPASLAIVARVVLGTLAELENNSLSQPRRASP